MILDSASNLFMTVILRALQLIQNLPETLTCRTNDRTFLEKDRESRMFESRCTHIERAAYRLFYEWLKRWLSYHVGPTGLFQMTVHVKTCQDLMIHDHGAKHEMNLMCQAYGLNMVELGK